MNQKTASSRIQRPHGRWELLLIILVCFAGSSELFAQVTGSGAAVPVVSGQTGDFDLTLVSPTNVDGIGAKLLFDPEIMEGLALSLDAGQSGFTLLQYDPTPGEIRFVVFKDPPDVSLNLTNPVLHFAFTAKSGLIGSSWAWLEFDLDAAAYILPSPPGTVVSVAVGGPGGAPEPKSVNFGSFAIPIIGRPLITTHPTNRSVNPGANVAFSVSATGPDEPFDFQWFGPGGLLVGATNPTLELNTVSPASAGTYRCDVSNVAGTSSSTSATLTVFSEPQPNAAQFNGDTIPDPVYAGHSIYVGLTFKNISAISWSAGTGHALAVMNDPDGLFGGQARIGFNGPDTVIAPNATVSFIPYLNVPAQPGTYNVTVQMIQEFVEFFGPSVQLVVNVVEKPNATGSWEIYE